MKKTVTFGMLSIFLIFPITIWAVNMESSRYRIQFGNVNIGATNMQSDNMKLSTTMGQLAAGKFESDGYVIKAGFQYIHSIIPFTFSISKTNINLGLLEPNRPSADVATLSASFGGAGQYQVTAVELGPLKTMSGNQIPDTKCDNNNNPCTISVAKIWQSRSAEGFGYNAQSLKGNPVPSDFINNNYYRPFSDTQNYPNQSPPIIISSKNVTADPKISPKDIYHQAAITFRVNIGPAQPSGSYQTIIKFVAIPTY